jgi:two-component system chemotaxis response regulator CheV
MSGALLESVERHTRLAGHNRVAMLLFRLGDAQLFGINVFKVREVLRRPPLERMPGAHDLIAGSCDYRGQTIAVIDLAAALGYPPLKDVASAHLLVTEFSRTVQGFLVADLRHMVHCDGSALVTPEPALGFGTLVAVVDVEHVLASIHGVPGELSAHMQRAVDGHAMHPRRVLVADDSLVARRQIEGVFRQMNIECVMVEDGVRALEKLQELAGVEPAERVHLVVSDIEMPQMDGYALTRAIRETPALRGLKVVLHSSISGMFNEAMVKEVAADRFIAKFQPDLLAQAVLDLLPG